jgi:hypothetical protein
MKVRWICWACLVVIIHPHTRDTQAGRIRGVRCRHTLCGTPRRPPFDVVQEQPKRGGESGGPVGVQKLDAALHYGRRELCLDLHDWGRDWPCDVELDGHTCSDTDYHVHSGGYAPPYRLVCTSPTPVRDLAADEQMHHCYNSATT